MRDGLYRAVMSSAWVNGHSTDQVQAHPKKKRQWVRSIVVWQNEDGEVLFSQIDFGELIQPTFPPGPGVETILIYEVKTNFVLGYLLGVQMRRHNYLCEL